MDIRINKNSSVPIYKQIASTISGHIMSGKIGWGSKLPSERRLAQSLNVHRNTIVKAYAILVDENLVSTDFHGKKGTTFVTKDPTMKRLLHFSGTPALRTS